MHNLTADAAREREQWNNWNGCKTWHNSGVL
jgi:hypothetical protein